MFDLQGGTVQCPFCNVAIPEDLDAGPSDPTVGLPVDPNAQAAPPIPTPGGFSTPDPTPLEGTMDPSAPVLHEDAPEHPPESAAAAAASSATTGALKVAAIAGGAFLAFKLGLLDNLLAVVGLSSAPPPPAVEAPAEPLPVPTPGAAPSEPTAPEAPFNPNPPGSGGPIAAVPEAPAAPPAAPAAAEWAFEGRVSDVLSMKPVKGAVLLFMNQAEDETFEARTDAKGQFSKKLPARKNGYKLVIDHPEYIAEYFDETDPPYRTWTQARRRQLRAAKPSHEPWKAPGADPVRRDVLLFPEFTDR
jgi:hypothetical protein